MTEGQKHERGQWASKFGFLMAAVGSAVGLGNIWGFPYKMGMGGGGAFLVVYIAMVVLVGVMVMLGELAIGRKTKKGAVGTYRALAKKYTWVGYMAVISPFLILSFYSVLGGMVLKYMASFVQALFSGGANFAGVTSGAFFGSFITNGSDMILYFAIFQILTLVIVMGGIEEGIERFSKIEIPALALILLGLICYVVTLPKAADGLAFMFKPNFAVFSDPEIGFMKVLKSAAGQMFFSLSLGMGIMITYGSYLSNDQDLSKDMFVIPLADTIVAIMAGMVVMPACFAFGLPPKAGPSLLFVSLHEVFVTGMGGSVGAFVGMMFYFLVFLAAITSSVSLLEVTTTFMLDRQTERGRHPNRTVMTLLMAGLIFLVGLPVALDGLGSNVAGGALINSPGVMMGMEKIPVAFDCWLDFYDVLSEGIMMPLGALLMSLLIGWKFGIGLIEEEVALTPGKKLRAPFLTDMCFKFIVPIILLVVLYAQLQDFGLI